MGSAMASMSVSLELKKPPEHQATLDKITRHVNDLIANWQTGPKSLCEKPSGSFCRILDLKIDTGEPSFLFSWFDMRSSLSLVDRKVPTSSSGGHSLIGELDRSTTFSNSIKLLNNNYTEILCNQNHTDFKKNAKLKKELRSISLTSPRTTSNSMLKVLLTYNSTRLQPDMFVRFIPGITTAKASKPFIDDLGVSRHE